MWVSEKRDWLRGEMRGIILDTPCSQLDREVKQGITSYKENKQDDLHKG